MKKLLYCAAALAMALFAGSCQQEKLEPVVNGSVTYTITLPETVQTKGESGYNSYDLYYEVYKSVKGDEVAAYTDPLFEEKVTFDGFTTTIALDLLNDQDYTILFWANKKVNEGETSWFDVTNLRNVKILSANSNNDDRDAFCGMDQLEQHDGTQSKTVELKRPFAQVNIATLVTTDKYDITPQSSYVEFSKIPVAYNVFTGKPEGGNTVVKYGVDANDEHVYTPIPGNPIANTYKNVAMNYVLVPESNIDVYYEIVTPNGTVKNNVRNVPVKPNYRTNIVGNLLTSNATYTVELKPGFEDIDGNDAHVEVINEGIVKNINGDYEVTNEAGLAYAINKEFAKGGNFYLTSAVYDLSGFAVNPPNVPDGVTLNIYGETPVVTRSATPSIAGITIKGLDRIIETISANANVSISGVELVDEGSVLVETNNGTLVVSESTGEEAIVSSGNNPVEANNVDKLASLNAALATGVKTINITADIADIPEVLLINNSVIINGNNKKITTSANRAFRLTTSDIEVTFNNLNIVSTAVMIYPSDVRGVAIDPNLSNVVLTLNDCTIDFTDKTTNDWTYAVNVAGNGTGHKVTVNGGSYEGANVINVYGAKNVITVKNAVLNCLYANSDMYYGSCIWVLQKQGSSVYAEGNTFNGNNAIAFNLGTGTALEEKDNVDNTKMVVAKVGDAYYTSLAEAFAAAESGATVKVLQNINLTSSVTNGKSLILDLNEKNIVGVESAVGSFGLINVSVGTELTINGPGKITLKSENNRGWNAYSSVVSNQRGTLTVNGDVEIEHLGGTDMAYGIDNLTNGKGTKATTTVNGATIISPYTAIRQFLNGTEADNTLEVKDGSVIEGGSRGIWMQGPSVNTNSGSLTVEEGAKVSNLHIGLAEGTTTVDIELSAAASAIGEGGVTSKNVPAGYQLMEVDGKWTIATVVSNTSELEAAVQKAVATDEDKVILLADVQTFDGEIKLTAEKYQKVIGNNRELIFKAAEGATPVIAGTVTLGYRDQGTGAAMFNRKVIFDGITFDHAENTKHSLNVQDVQSLTLKNCKIIGDGEYGIESARGNATGTSKIKGCTFVNAAMQLLGNLATGLVIDECTFNESRINVQAGNGVTVENCTFNNTLKPANVGDSFYCVRSNSTPITVKDSKININSELTEVATSQSKWYLLANRGTTNWTVENVAVTLSDATLIQTELKVVACTSTGKINATNLTVNGLPLGVSQTAEGVWVADDEVSGSLNWIKSNKPEVFLNGKVQYGTALYSYSNNGADVVMSAAGEDAKVVRGLVEATVKNVTVLEGIKIIGDRTFRDAPNLASVVLPQSLTELEEGAFQGSGLTTITIPGEKVALGKQSIGYLPNLETITITANEVTIANYVARSCPKLKSVYIHSNKVTFAQGASMFFTDCESNNTSGITFYVSSQEIADAVNAATPNGHAKGMQIKSIDGSITYYTR